MKFWGCLLCFVMLVCISAVCSEGDKTATPTVTSLTYNAQLVRGPAKTEAHAKPSKAPNDKVDGNDRVCYTMHSLLVSRERDSDATRLVGERTCTASNQFQTKHTAPKK